MQVRMVATALAYDIGLENKNQAENGSGAESSGRSHVGMGFGQHKNVLTVRRKFLHPCPAETWCTTPCTCDEGFSMWHLLALGLLSKERARSFLAGTVAVRGGVLLDDLLEHTTSPLSPWCWNEAGYDKSFIGVADKYVGLSVEQLCRMQGTSLLGNYLQWGALDWPMHPIVLWFEQWIGCEVLR